MIDEEAKGFVLTKENNENYEQETDLISATRRKAMAGKTLLIIAISLLLPIFLSLSFFAYFAIINDPNCSGANPDLCYLAGLIAGLILPVIAVVTTPISLILFIIYFIRKIRMRPQRKTL